MTIPVVAIAVACCVGCQGTPASRSTFQFLGDRLPDGWRVAAPDVSPPLVAALSDKTDSRQSVTVYIEGDGQAWRTRHEPALDPTPSHAVGLGLATRATDDGPVLYLGRPCQYEARESLACRKALWTSARYGQANITAISEAIDALVPAERALTLVGYSGGGVIAALLAARREDVTGIITIAANLDIAAWTDHHGVSPLAGSLSPLNDAATLSRIPQVHLVGGRDQIVPPPLLSGYLNALTPYQPTSKRIMEYPDFDHHCCWIDDWPKLQAEAMAMLAEQRNTTRSPSQ